MSACQRINVSPTIDHMSYCPRNHVILVVVVFNYNTYIMYTHVFDLVFMSVLADSTLTMCVVEAECKACMNYYIYRRKGNKLRRIAREFIAHDVPIIYRVAVLVAPGLPRYSMLNTSQVIGEL